MRFSDLVRVDKRPDQAAAAERAAVDTDSYLNQLHDDPRNNGFVSALTDRRRSTSMKATRRGFLRGTIAAAAATTAVTAVNMFGPARKVEAQSGIVGTYPRRILQFCPPYNSGDNCQPGCGSSPICTDCCGSDGYFRNDPGNGYTLYAGGCGDGDIADGWLWRFKGKCGSCAEIEYRCSDGYVQTDLGPAPFICRQVTDCVPLAEGEAPGEALVDQARDTNWRPAGALEVAIDQGTTVSINGWIADGSGVPVDMRILANGAIVHIGKAFLARPDIASSVRGAGPTTGFGVSFPIAPGQYEFCVDAMSGLLTARIGCVNMNVGSGGSVRGSGATGSIAPPPAAPSAPDPDATPEPTPGPTPTPSAVVLPDESSGSDSPTYGAVQVIRRAADGTGFVSGWAGDPDTDEPVFIDILVDDESVVTTRTDLPRPDVAKAFGEMHSSTGFAVSFPLPDKTVDVCVVAVSPDDGQRRSLGCEKLRVAEADAVDGADVAGDSDGRPVASGPVATNDAVVYGGIDAIETGDGSAAVRGWSFDPNDRDRVIVVSAVAAGVTTSGETGLENLAAQRIYGVDASCGFEIELELPAGVHPVTVSAVTSAGTTVTIGRQTVAIA